ncbi:MAG: protease inhibitor I42 family protein [Anaerosomatales bacterium]|nr:protease inhibitor I42 family protein [Anaerosomatales bacterium]
MRIKVMVAAFVVAALLAVAGCDAAASEVIIDDQDDGGSVRLGIGQVLVVRLPANPTTGFTWTAAETPAFLERLGEPEFSPESDALGAGGIQEFRYAASEPGEGSLELEYARSWEDVPAEDEYTVTVTVK